jgi:hypothetical protein
MSDMVTAMEKSELARCFRTLGLEPREAAKLLSVDVKTITRWLTGEIGVPGPAEQALLAWMQLEERRIPWRPGGLPINIMGQEEIEDQIRLMREHVIILDDVLSRVKRRGGPAAPWRVDLKRCEAELANIMHLHFYPLPNGNFSASSYRRTDKEPDYKRDLPLIEDAIACIADAVAAARRAGRNWVDER